MLFADRQIVPALMFHSVGLEAHPWIWNYLAEPVDTFENKLRLLKNKGFNTVVWDEVVAHVNNSQRLPDNSIMLTFDDGYLDNWVFAYPLLRKYGMRATIYVSTDFIDPGDEPRKNLESVWHDECGYDDLQVPGFLRASEIKLMSDSQVIDIQSHAATHTWHLSGNKAIDFYSRVQPDKYPWLAWNLRPDRKAFYLNENQTKFVPPGTPVFEHDCGIIATRFFPDPEPIEALADFVDSQGAQDFMSKNDAKERIRNYLETCGLGHGWPGRTESHEERSIRVERELWEAKQKLEAVVAKPVSFLSWPNGAYDADALRLAAVAGFNAWTLGSRDRRRYRNKPGGDVTVLKRIGTSNKLTVRGVRCRDQGPVLQYLKIRAHQNSRLWRLALNTFKVFSLLLALVTAR